MSVKITDEAKNEVFSMMGSSGFKDPVLRLNIAGFG